MAIYDYIRDYLPAIPILELKKGEYLFRADRDDGLLFYILEGVVRVENVSYNGKKLIVDVLQEDEFTGSISNIHHADFQCSGIAETDVRCWVLKKSLMNELLENVEFSALFYQKTSKRVYMMYKRILARTLFGQHENLAYYILDNSENDYFEYKSIYNMCEVLGISRRGIYNILYRFEENGYIEKQGQKYRISDRKSLEAAAGQVMDFMKTEDG
jgi:CRP-like cAMP-binding protein